MLEPVLCGRLEAARLLGLGTTTTDKLISEGVLESVRVGARRMVTLRSIRRLAGIETEPTDEASR